MIRLVQRKLIIPRGDTGNFSLSVPKEANTGDVAVFTIIDPRTNTKVYEKITEPVEQLITIVFTHNDTVNLPVGRYLWDVKFYVNPTFADEKLVDGDEVDSYYAAYTLPECEVRQTGDDLMTSDDSPSSTLTPESLNIITAAITEATQAKNAAAASAAEAQGYVEQITELSAEAETLPAGASATAAYDAETGVLTLGLPRGDAFSVAKTYPTIAAMNADYSGSDTSVGDFVMIVSIIGDPDNAKLYVKGAERFEFVVDMSGANGVGVQSIVKSGTVENVDTYTITYTDGTTTTYNVVNGVDGDEYTVMVQDTQPTQETNKLWIPIQAGVVQEVPTVQEMQEALSGKADKVNTVLETSLSLGRKNNTPIGTGSFAFGTNITASGMYSIATGNMTKSLGAFSNAEGNTVSAYGLVSHAEGSAPSTTVQLTGAANATTYAVTSARFLAPYCVITIGSKNSKIISVDTANNTITVSPSFGEALNNTEGFVTYGGTFGFGSHSEGNGTIAASDYQHTEGQYNVIDANEKYATIIGNGNSETATSNAYALDWDGNGHYAGDVYVGANADSTGGTKLAKITDIPSAPVQDVQINNTSIIDANGVANIQKASDNNLGVVGIEPQSGVIIASNGKLEINPASTADIKKGENTNKPIVVFKQDAAAFYGLATAAGDTTQSTSSNAVGTYTDEAKAAIRSMIGVENSFSPIATVTKSGKVVTITITDKNGTTTQTITEEDGIFYADYGVTTFDDIENATNDGKIVICRYEPRSGETIYSPLCSLKSNAPAQARFTIVGSDPNLMCYRFACTALSGWSMDSWKRNAVTRTAQVASGDFIAFADASYNDQIAKSDNLKFGDDPNKYLANNGTWQEVEDGYSPTVTVTDITGGHRVTITDADGAHTFDVMDGTGSVQDVQVNGTSVVNDGVANVPLASANEYGVIRAVYTYGVELTNSSYLRIYRALSGTIKAGTDAYRPITPSLQHESAFYGIASAAGDTTQSASSNAVGTYTENAKSKISEMLNGSVSVTGTTPTITALSGIQYVCGEVSTLDITLPASGIVDVVFTSGSTPTVLTITPPTGVTVKWANGFDPTSLEANTTYEINIKDGLGVAVGWT